MQFEDEIIRPVKTAVEDIVQFEHPAESRTLRGRQDIPVVGAADAADQCMLDELMVQPLFDPIGAIRLGATRRLNQLDTTRRTQRELPVKRRHGVYEVKRKPNIGVL
jgi:hypothetical protein